MQRRLRPMDGSHGFSAAVLQPRAASWHPSLFNSARRVPCTATDAATGGFALRWVFRVLGMPKRLAGFGALQTSARGTCNFLLPYKEREMDAVAADDHNATHHCVAASNGFTALENLPRVFFSRPLEERLAAVMVARFTTSTTGAGAATTVAGCERGGKSIAMPLKTFIQQMPALTRKTIAQSGGDVLRWIEQCAMLEVVELGPSCWTDGQTQAASDGLGTAEVPHDRRRWVRVRHGAAECILRVSQGATGEETSATGALVPPPSVADETWLETAEGRAAFLETLESALRRRSASTQQRYCLLQEAYPAARAAAAEHTSPALQRVARHLCYAKFESMVLHDHAFQARLWVLQDRVMTWRDPTEEGPPRFVKMQPEASRATPENNYGGWGSASAVPTCEDVYEILKYIPVNWGNLGNVNIPPAVKRRHLRSSSPLQWFRRQPYYFEVRNMNGTTEIRRSAVLHPEAHNMTLSEAHERLRRAVAVGEANSLVPLGPDGRPLPREMSGVEGIVHKFFLRVCPSYFAPLSLVMQRYTKKNLTEDGLLDMAKRRTAEFELYHSRYADVPLVRKRVGADSARWRNAFVEDLERYPEDVQGIIIIMNRLCPTWDRPEYVYVRLSPLEQRRVGGYEGMTRILQRHPALFRVGRHFVCRVDSSDPFSQQEEPAVMDMTSRSYLREENPYLSPLDIAKVFHYVAPPDEPCSAKFFVECASPAMRVALPPRVITILQQFPRLFTCRETAPGVYAVRKLQLPPPSAAKVAPWLAHEGWDPAQHGASDPLREYPSAPDEATTPSGMANSLNSGDSSWMLESELAAEETLSRAEVIAAVKALIPAGGVTNTNLLLWVSMSLQQAASHHYGSLMKMVRAEKNHFTVTEGPEAIVICRARDGT